MVFRSLQPPVVATPGALSRTCGKDVLGESPRLSWPDASSKDGTDRQLLEGPLPVLVRAWDAGSASADKAPPVQAKLSHLDLLSVFTAGSISAAWLAAYGSSREHLAPSQLPAFWLALAVQAAFPFALAYSNTCSRHRDECAALLRLLQPAVMLLLGRQGVQGGLSALSSNAAAADSAAAAQQAGGPQPSEAFWAFLFQSLLASNAVLLALAAFSSRLPLGRHLAVHGLALLAALYVNLGACEKVCSPASGGALLEPYFQRALGLLSLLAAPALATTGLGSASELIPRPTSPRFQCWLLWSFQALFFGALLPTLALLCRDVAHSRRARSAAKGAAHSRPKAEEGSLLAVLDGLQASSFTNGAFLLVAGTALAWILAALGATLVEGAVLGPRPTPVSA
ncbi:hypothetical protein N2152v2_000456 [Parachlorella kessleri]